MRLQALIISMLLQSLLSGRGIQVIYLLWSFVLGIKGGNDGDNCMQDE